MGLKRGVNKGYLKGSYWEGGDIPARGDLNGKKEFPFSSVRAPFFSGGGGGTRESSEKTTDEEMKQAEGNQRTVGGRRGRRGASE